MDYTTTLNLYPFLAFFILILSIKQAKKLHKAKNLPPGPKRIPILGNLHQLKNPIHRSFQIQAKQHGPLMFMQLGSVPTVIISSADVLSEIFKSHDLVFSGRPVLYSANKLTYNCSDIVFTPYGDKWREMRKMATIELLSSKKVQSFRQVRKEEVDSMLDSVANSCSGNNLIDLSKLTLELSNNVVCRVAFGKKFENGASKIGELLSEAQDLLGGFCVADFFPWMGWMCKLNGYEARLERNFRELDNFYEAIIEEHRDPNRDKPENDDLVDVLLRAQKDPTRQFPLSNDSIKGVLTDMFIAGTDTASAALVWTITELIRNPSVMERAKEEIRRSIIKGKNRIEESDLPPLIYLKSVVKESLRVHPPAPLSVPRETTKDSIIRGYEIPARTRVIINAASISVDPQAWDNPQEFWPERFLDSKIDFAGQHFEYVPFGVGRRVCPGMNFSTVLIELALANLLLLYDWELPNGMVKEALDMEEASGITMHKKTHLCLVATPILNIHHS